MKVQVSPARFLAMAAGFLLFVLKWVFQDEVFGTVIRMQVFRPIALYLKTGSRHLALVVAVPCRAPKPMRRYTSQAKKGSSKMTLARESHFSRNRCH